MVKLIKVQCNAFDADGKNGFTSESVHVPQPVVWIMDLPIVFHPVSEIMQNNYVQLYAFYNK